MFQITIKLAPVSRSGIEALDFCRAYGLPETAHVYGISSRAQVTIEVDEAFARAWFDREALYEDEEITHDMLLPGEMILTGQAVALAELEPARIRDLFIAARFRSLRAELEEARKPAEAVDA
jgi:hypothetical protein